ncbi:uncharacterized protein LOC120707611 isoform X1 [Panicum virgatum]|uniref:uncharacterized protein LOC120707611 isoform X1 n=1 Tax=Panicum virgatum TaxID=38727 RepID=UPI0019D69031|nr:uncharacterized protein LOC120707611 isoform X1 [Panicum virgatum]
MDKVSDLIVSWQSLNYFDEMNYFSNEFLTFAVTSPMNGILERVGQKEGGSSMTVDQIISVLNDLECISTTRDPEQFTFDLNKLVETCRNDEVESLVKKKHGQEAYTIFRLLLKQGGPVETDEITDRTILDKQIVHETLYKLWKDEYIDSERVPSAASGTGNSHFLVWRVKNTYREHYIDHLYHAALNLRLMANCMAELLEEGCFEPRTWCSVGELLTNCTKPALLKEKVAGRIELWSKQWKKATLPLHYSFVLSRIL